MASMLLRASRYAASAASRCAAVAASGSGGAAASNPLLRRFPLGRGRDLSFSAPSALDPRPDAKDLEGEEALFTLYERWCKASGDERDQDEMRRRFNMLKDNNPVLFKYRLNKEEPVNIRINRLADREYRGEKCGQVEFFADTKDIESDEALWGALYERWCKAFGEERDQDEMRRLFNEFKDTVLSVDCENQTSLRFGQYVRYGIRKMLDGKRFELMAFKTPLCQSDTGLPPNTKIFLRTGKDLQETQWLPWA